MCGQGVFTGRSTRWTIVPCPNSRPVSDRGWAISRGFASLNLVEASAGKELEEGLSLLHKTAVLIANSGCQDAINFFDGSGRGYRNRPKKARSCPNSVQASEADGCLRDMTGAVWPPIQLLATPRHPNPCGSTLGVAVEHAGRSTQSVFGNCRLGSTGHWPVPSGDSPDGTGRASSPTRTARFLR